MKTLTLAAVLSLAATAYSQEAPDVARNSPGDGPVDAPQARESSRLAIEGDVTWVTAYFSDGYNLGDEGLFLQPQVTVAYEAVSNDQFTITPWANAWANITDQKYDGGRYFDELDLAVGVDVSTGRWTFGLEYIYYVSPTDTFDDVHEFGVSVAFDDSELTPLPFALNPYVSFHIEAEDKGGPESSFIELGIEPEFEISQCPVTISVPIATVINVNEYYYASDGDETTFGVISAGLTATYQINDNWWVAGGVDYIYLLANSTIAANDDDRDEWIGRLAVGFSY